MQLITAIAVLALVSASSIARAQTAEPQTQLVSMKDGESVQLDSLTWINTETCAPLFKGVTAIDVSEGPPEISLKFEPGKVGANNRHCKNGQAEGGTIIATAKGVTEPGEKVLTYRVRFETKGSGSRQQTMRYPVLLFPADATQSESH
jgi:hypothetical protein